MRSKNAVFKFVNRLEDIGWLKGSYREAYTQVISIRCLGFSGTVEAGFPSAAEEELADTLSFDDLLVGNREATFLLKVSGDSMTEAGILPGDMVIVDRSQTPKSGDIVIAEVDGEWTMKYLRKRGIW